MHNPDINEAPAQENLLNNPLAIVHCSYPPLRVRASCCGPHSTGCPLQTVANYRACAMGRKGQTGDADRKIGLMQFVYSVMALTAILGAALSSFYSTADSRSGRVRMLAEVPGLRAGRNKVRCRVTVCKWATREEEHSSCCSRAAAPQLSRVPLHTPRVPLAAVAGQGRGWRRRWVYFVLCPEPRAGACTVLPWPPTTAAAHSSVGFCGRAQLERP